MGAEPTPGPWFVGAQNDALYVVAGRPPSQSNDYPWHDAPSALIAKTFDDKCDGGSGPIVAVAEANARVIAAAPDLLDAARGLLASSWCENTKLISPFKELVAAVAKAEGRS
jgi:hypothetical protein